MLRNKLKQLRLNMAAEQGRDITQKEFAEILGVAHRAYCDWENNSKQPNAESIAKIIRKLNIEFFDIFQEG